jgi:hypothetical protein
MLAGTQCMGAAQTVATFTSGSVTAADLEAQAFLDNARRLDEGLAAAVRAPQPGSDARTSQAQLIAYRRILAETAKQRGVRADGADAARAAFLRELTLYKVLYIESIAPAVEAERSQWRRELEQAHRTHPEECQVPGQYWFRYSFVGDPETTPADWIRHEERARQVRRALAKGDDFTEVAKRLSDSLPAEDRGELVGPVLSSGIPADRVKVLEALDIGGISEPFRTNRGYMILKLERRVPKTMLTADQASATLVARGRLRRFRAEDALTSAHQALVAAYPVTFNEPAMSALRADGDTVIAESSLIRLRNADVYDDAFRKANPGAEDKELRAAARERALRATCAALAQRDHLHKQPVYGQAMRLLEEARLAAGLLAEPQAMKEAEMPPDCATRSVQCMEEVLRANQFVMRETR